MESKSIGKLPHVTSQSSEKSSSSIETSISKTTLDPNNPRPVLKHQPKATFTSTGESCLADNTSSETQKQCSAPSESTPGNSFRMSIDEDHPAKGKRIRSQYVHSILSKHKTNILSSSLSGSILLEIMFPIFLIINNNNNINK